MATHFDKIEEDKIWMNFSILIVSEQSFDYTLNLGVAVVGSSAS